MLVQNTVPAASYTLGDFLYAGTGERVWDCRRLDSQKAPGMGNWSKWAWEEQDVRCQEARLKNYFFPTYNIKTFAHFNPRGRS